jgi:hypothetical protein
MGDHRVSLWQKWIQNGDKPINGDLCSNTCTMLKPHYGRSIIRSSCAGSFFQFIRFVQGRPNSPGLCPGPAQCKSGIVRECLGGYGSRLESEGNCASQSVFVSWDISLSEILLDVVPVSSSVLVWHSASLAFATHRHTAINSLSLGAPLMDGSN